MKIKSLGLYIVVNPDICHGEPTFRGTRIFVADVLGQIANGMDWEAIIEEWRGKLTRGAIAEAIRWNTCRRGKSKQVTIEELKK